jgi:hypothetical protein
MTTLEKAELGIIALVGAGTAAFASAWTASVGQVIGIAAAVILAQGLVRDVVKLVVKRRAMAGEAGPRRIVCLCAESTVGLLLVCVSTALVFSGLDQPVHLGHLLLSFGVPGLLLFGFVAKDYVISVRRETDHASVLVW